MTESATISPSRTLARAVRSSGVIEAANVIDGKLPIRIDDPAHATPDDVNVISDG